MNENSPEAAFMREAIALSRGGFPAPNPRVGCVIVRDGVVVGRGYHDHAGGPHAEAVALREAGELARGATVFVTLEPCAHFGRTPPCADALIASGVKTVWIACLDPNPVASGGIEKLRAAGIEVQIGLLAAEAEAVNGIYLFAKRMKRPYVVVKAAMTLDGMISHADGVGPFITGESARSDGHRSRAELGAVLVGRKTVETDNPQLTARIEGVVNQPLKIVLDREARLSSECRVFQGEYLRVVRPGLGGDYRLEVPVQNGKLDLEFLLQRLYDIGPISPINPMGPMGLIGLMVEGGGETNRSFLAENLVDQIDLYIAPKIFGTGIPWLAKGVALPQQGWRLDSTQAFDQDFRLTYLRTE